MRFRRKMRRGPRRGSPVRAHGDWITCQFNTCLDTLTPDPCNALNPGHVFSSAWIDGSDLSLKEDGLTVVRLVGNQSWSLQLTLHHSGLTTPFNYRNAFTLWEGVYVATSDHAGDIIEMDPRKDTEMESSLWMYLRNRTVGFVETLGVGFTDATNVLGFGQNECSELSAHYDIRVKRRMKQGQLLVYVAGITQQGTGAPSGGTEAFTGLLDSSNIRAYVKF